MPRNAYGAKPTVEGCRNIDVLAWNKLGYLRGYSKFSWAWTCDGETTATINVEAERISVRLNYRARSYGGDWEDVAQRVPLQWDSCRFGGERPWFVCPVNKNGRFCGRQVTKLYGGGKLFACRHCYGLAYSSQQESVRGRGLQRAQSIRMRLGGNVSMFDPFPEKPKGMHTTTYDRLRDRYKHAERRSLVGVMKFLERYR